MIQNLCMKVDVYKRFFFFFSSVFNFLIINSMNIFNVRNLKNLICFGHNNDRLTTLIGELNKIKKKLKNLNE